MMKETDLVPPNEKTETNGSSKAIKLLKKRARVKTNFTEESAPSPSPQPKEIPVNKWTMPPGEQGYIKINDNDFL